MSPTAQRPILRAVVTVAVLAGALTGCTSADTPAAGSSDGDCGGKVAEVLLADESAHAVVTFDAADSPKIFNLPATPAPTCAYRSVSTRQQGAGEATVTHRTYLYLGISDADAKKLIAAVTATGKAANWTASFSNVPASTATPAPSVLQTAQWEYNASGSAGADRGSISFAYNQPVNPGIVAQAGLSGDPNLLRIETEIRSPKK